MKQAQLVAERLVSLGLNFSRLETSTSPRAIETANIIETKLREFKSPVSKFQPNPDLREGWPTMPQPTALYPKRTGKVGRRYDCNDYFVNIAYVSSENVYLPVKKWKAVAFAMSVQIM